MNKFLENSVCNGCKHLVSRVIKLYNPYILLEDMGIPVENLDLDLDADEEIIIKHRMCTKLGIELDHDVLECDGWEPKVARNPLMQSGRII